MNLMTSSMEKMTKMLRDTDAKLKTMGDMPYRQRKATPKEQMEMYQNLTEADLYQMVEKHGTDAVNKWLYRMEQRSKNG